MTPGGWTATGWGAQHLIVTTDASWTVLACHRPGQRVPTGRITPDAAETRRCARCPHGLLPAPVVGEIRRRSDGATVVCETTWDGRRPASPTDRVWRDTSMGALLDGYEVAGWAVMR
ncbi:hypothetical protein [Micromonospora carbonacea]|uniref:Uncharacterized protein n=1 Tax=Micromonospora carbonacea TaxID=47853 RepID=A0A1C5ACG3_9ACTN|nr:hypothetical protein [Micromonospora carbonacea]SCF42952.1 hypothetical protein GA0070563_112162 [Micromonospora carbonacea]